MTSVAYQNDANEHANLTPKDLQEMRIQASENPEKFWTQQANRLTWTTPFTKVKNTSFEKDNVKINWFEDGELNACYNCVDRHAEKTPNKTAIIWEGNSPDEQKTFTYKQLYHQVCRFANVLKNLKINKGDRVVLYMPMIPEAVFAMLACARIGAVHSVVFGGFSAKALRDRVDACEAKLVITADEGRRGDKKIALKACVDEALQECKTVDNVLVIKATGGDVAWNAHRDVWYHEQAKTVSDTAYFTRQNAEDPLFILYTSGSTGKPKGLVHTTGGYLTYAAYTHNLVFDLKSDDIFWCTADVGWITGHSYLVYGPLANGCTTVVYEGVPTYPDASRFWNVIDKHKVSVFYTAPTALRMLMGVGDEAVTKTSRTSLRVLGSVGEPINPEVWEWYYKVVGNNNCPIVDTWWQTETGGIVIAPVAGTSELKPGSATKPLPGISAEIIDSDGDVINGAGEGSLVLTNSFPGQARSIYGDHKRFEETYFETHPGAYCTGDGAKRDANGFFWITGRSDDVIKVSGHRLGTAEIESALVSHPLVSEAAVVGFPHEIKGQAIYAFVTLMQDVNIPRNLVKKLNDWVRDHIGPVATPEVIQIAPGLPKTRSGKIMRRILRKIAEGDFDNLGDTSTLADPDVVHDLIAGRV